MGFLLGNLLGFDSGGEFGREGKMLEQNNLTIFFFLFFSERGRERSDYRQGDVVQHNVKSSGSFGEVLSNQSCYIFSLRNQLAGVELGDYTFKDLVDNGGKNTFVIVGTKGTVNLRKSINSWA